MAILHDANSYGNDPSNTSLSVSHTCTGTQRILWAVVFTTGNDNITGVTYGGVSMTQAVKRTTASSQTIYLYYLIAPATGANNIVANCSGASNLTIQGMSFTGAQQSGVPDATGSADSSGTTASVTLTTIADNCFAVLGTRFNTGTRTVGAGMTAGGINTYPADGLYTTSAKTPAGSLTMTNDCSASTIWGAVGASFAPAVSNPPTLDTLATTSITDVSATLNGEITDIGGSTPDERGFVWGTTSQADPGDVAPVSAGYDDYNVETGSFGAGVFDNPITGLVASTTYYVRCYAHNDDGYAYGDEISFSTSAIPPFRFTNINGVIFDENDTQTIFAERLNDMLERIEALEV